ncbi:MAG TPA: DUF255 domain-containing protein [Holophagaceae bacterium]|jgi:uncharacterized protein YyaL (SSP411 family)|nr:DUF255 domain-containing protein [Holophagaceae bacterium]
MRRLIILLAATLLQAQALTIHWRPWSPAAFAEAKQAGKPVLVDAVATWCHWCHVMDAKTYGHPEVAALLEAKFIPVRVDIDQHPDAAELYADIGWPGTAIYAPDGKPLDRERGFIEPGDFKALLERALEGKGGLGAAERASGVTVPDPLAASMKELDSHFDISYGGWGKQKYPIAMNIEEALDRARHGDESARFRALYTLAQQRHITDPVWGGLFQYSAGPDWHQPHFERLTTLQAGYLRNLAEAFRATGDADFREDARRDLGFLRRFMAHPDGGFSATMDADAHGQDGHVYQAMDDAGRVKAGLPRIDTRRYAQVQGLMIAALADLSGVMDDLALFREARAAEAWSQVHLGEEGAYRHTEGQEGLFLADQAGMLQGLIALHEATGEAVYLDRAVALADSVEKAFLDSSGLYRARAASPGELGAFAEARLPFDDNASFSRSLLRLEAITGDARDRDRATRILALLSQQARLDDQGRWLGDYILAMRALKGLGHLAVVGDPAKTGPLFRAAQAAWLPETVILLVDSTKPVRNPDLSFPALDKPAAFLCGRGTCSAPFTDAKRLVENLKKAAR